MLKAAIARTSAEYAESVERKLAGGGAVFVSLIIGGDLVLLWILGDKGVVLGGA